MQTQTTDAKSIGVVYRKTKGRYDVHLCDALIHCTLSAKLWKDFELSSGRVQDVDRKHHDPIAVGDRVAFIPVDDGAGLIVEILPRRNALVRTSARPMHGAHAFEQVIAANLGQVVPVFAATNPEPKWRMLDRLLVAAESGGIPSLVVVTKIDLLRGQSTEKDLLVVVERYRQIGYPVVLVSAQTGEGLDDLRQTLAGKTSVLAGKSGVGKSTLLNALDPHLDLAAHSVNPKTGKGRHTTSHLEMYPLTFGGAVIDTPGTREFGIWDLQPERLADCFPEMRSLLGRCQFGLSCTHDDEPGCAIRQAVMAGAVSPHRYQSYLRLKADL